MKNILVDTGFWLAGNHPKDTHHNRVIEWLKKNKGGNYRFVTTWIVLCESFFMIKTFVNFNTAVRFLDSYSKSAFDVFNLEDEHTNRMVELLKKYENLSVDLADISLVIAAEQYSTGEILTVDESDFDSLRWNKNKRFKLLLRDY